MSSTNPRNYYHSSSRREPQTGDGQNLPPLRNILGDQLDLPLPQRDYHSPYDLRDISRALPPSTSDFSDYRNTHRFTAVNTPHTSSRHGREHTHSQRQYTHPLHPVSSHSSEQSRHRAPPHDDRNYEAHNSSYLTSTPPTSKRYACTWEGCDKRFERQYALNTHMNIHLEQKPFACPVAGCDKVFNARSNMRRHLQTHREVQLDGHFSHEDDAGGNERGSGYFHRSRHDDTAPDARSRPFEHHSASPAQTYYSSTRRV